ncbi:MAG: polyribonucleotide nucleotidyltransferase [Parcubacteria group bacterium]|nr:polyribonucleotide nucleotidyltransferase [Parcubacteria group bacterium]
MEKQKFEMEIAGKSFKIQLGGLADQASGSCRAQFGDTVMLCTAQIGRERPEMGFFPLTCEFEEKFYAAGKILGSRFMRREGRPSTDATLNARMIDRSIRPLFPAGLINEIQVMATCLSWDTENDPAVIGLNGASLSLGLSEIPWAGPVGAVRIGKVDGKLVLCPNYEQREEGEIDTILVGTEKDGQIVINMIESGSKEVTEEAMLEIYDFAVPVIKQIIDFQNDIIKKHGKEKLPAVEREVDKGLETKLKASIAKKLEKALYQKDKIVRSNELRAIEDESLTEFEETLGDNRVKDILEEEVEKMFKENVLKNDKRPDGRKMDEVRNISCEVELLPRAHGSGLFTRGMTRILSVITLGSPGDQQLFDNMESSGKKRFMHHYNFPPYSVGEVKRVGSPGRREIGHGMLAEKAVQVLLPSMEKFPYTIRIVSEALSSNGSTSMASVSGSCLALMDAGVPISAPAAGIAVGLVVGKTLDDFKLLTDIQGPEDHYGDMDFKVAGTEKGITAVQMDVKTDGITKEIMKEAFERAKKARLGILEEIKKTIPEPRKELSKYAPKIHIININPDKIGAVIGSGGKIINGMIDEYGVSIDIEDTGEVFVSGDDAEGVEKALEQIKNLTREFELGETFQGKVVGIKDFGAFVELVPGKDGLVHISELAPFRVNKVEDVVKEGDIIPVKIVNIDTTSGKIGLSARQAGFKPKDSSSKQKPFHK